MIILITGATHTGKTRLAQQLLEQYHYPYISQDHLKMGLIRSGNTELTPETADEKLTGYLWPITREMIKTAIENEQNLIVEGCYIPFDWAGDFGTEYRRHIRFLCITLSADYINHNYKKILKNSDCIESRMDNSYCTKGLLKMENLRFRQGCLTHGLPFLSIQEDYLAELETFLQERFEEWKVLFEGDFRAWGKQKPGKEIVINREFDWAGHHWLLPSGYICSKGLVLDICMQSTREMVDDLNLDFFSRVLVNGTEMDYSQSCGLCFDPFPQTGDAVDGDAYRVVEHYGLEQTSAWSLYRISYPWNGQKTGEIKTLDIFLEQVKAQIPGEQVILQAGVSRKIMGSDGVERVLHVLSLETERLPDMDFAGKDLEYPGCYTAMRYTLVPDDPDLMLADTDPGDIPRSRSVGHETDVAAVSEGVASSVTLIGGADGPCTVFLAGLGQGVVRHACSSLHFEEQGSDILWQLIYNKKQYDDKLIELI